MRRKLALHHENGTTGDRRQNRPFNKLGIGRSHAGDDRIGVLERTRTQDDRTGVNRSDLFPA